MLVVEDSSLHRALIKGVLSRDAYEVRFAASKQEGVQLYHAFAPNLVITDWTLPDGTGLEVCEHIRKLPQAGYCYVVLLTAQTDKDHVVRGLAAGADDYLTKPYHDGELLARLAAGRRIIELQRELQSKNNLLEELALTDALTGLPNRRAIEQIATREISAGARHAHPVWVVLADLDRFKGINDTYGHDAGDRVIRSFADILKSNTRQSNGCGRLGGEEFMVVLSHADSNGVLTAVERIRTQFAAQVFQSTKGEFHASASFGVAWVLPAEDLSAAVSRADLALYRAKAAGRNRIEGTQLFQAGATGAVSAK
ncbi:MAG TPA: diguanylate cyclase [Candidatus Koribacter sp.]